MKKTAEEVLKELEERKQKKLQQIEEDKKRQYPLFYINKCHAGSPNGEFCDLRKDHEGLHVAKATKSKSGEAWAGSYDQGGVELIKAINKYHSGLCISLLAEMSKVYGNIFDEATEKMEYSYCPDCEHNRD